MTLNLTLFSSYSYFIHSYDRLRHSPGQLMHRYSQQVIADCYLWLCHSVGIYSETTHNLASRNCCLRSARYWCLTSLNIAMMISASRLLL